VSAAGVHLSVGITGASGAVCAAELLRTLEGDERVERVHLVVSDNALRVLAEELGLPGRSSLLERLLGAPARKTALLHDSDIGAGIASGSHPSAGMVVLPCSMGTLAAIAHGLADSLIARAADVCLKERRPLVLCVRETPLNRVHLKNMLAADEAGAVIFPLTPSFYNQPESTAEMARQFAFRVLAHLGLPQTGMYRWKAEE
jgi:flavin prenyltransferase